CGGEPRRRKPDAVSKLGAFGLDRLNERADFLRPLHVLVWIELDVVARQCLAVRRHRDRLDARPAQINANSVSRVSHDHADSPITDAKRMTKAEGRRSRRPSTRSIETRASFVIRFSAFVIQSRPSETH